MDRDCKYVRISSDETFILDEIDNVYELDTWGLTPDNILLEIGGHVGEISMTCAKRYGCRVVVYECSPKNYEMLVRNVELNELTALVETHHLAITRDGRKVRVYEHPINSGWSSPIGKNTSDPIVDSITLKDAIEKIRRKKGFIQVLLMDCEGFEFELLEDMTLLAGIPKFRGEFHASMQRNKELLAKLKLVIPDSDPILLEG